MVSALMGGLHFWWPKITGRLYPEFLGQVAAWTMFLGFNLTFFPQFLLGYLGMPRRYHTYPPEFQVLNVMSSLGASVLAVGYILPFLYLAWSLRWGKKAPQNPWHATGLEWEKADSPPIKINFSTPPSVHGPAYDYDPTEEVDYV